ncbi:MAG: hypothetical protein EBY29_11930, partial [Planctomycetes bacterium]|nr:hypothetical protein [Planctomycetota bacterium]
MTAIAARTAAEISQRGRIRSAVFQGLFEGSIRFVLTALTLLSVLTTVAIIAVLVEETVGFFTMPDHPEISLWSFFTG